MNHYKDVNEPYQYTNEPFIENVKSVGGSSDVFETLFNITVEGLIECICETYKSCDPERGTDDGVALLKVVWLTRDLDSLLDLFNAGVEIVKPWGTLPFDEDKGYKILNLFFLSGVERWNHLGADFLMKLSWLATIDYHGLDPIAHFLQVINWDECCCCNAYGARLADVFGRVHERKII